MSQVVLVRTDDRISGMGETLNLLQPEGILGRTALLKPNFNTADPAPAATDSKLLEALVQELQRRGAGQIIIDDRSGMANLRDLESYNG